VVNSIFVHLSIIAAHIGQKIIENEKIDVYCSSPCDIAIICHERKYTYKEILTKMMSHLAEFDYLEQRGEVFLIEDKWRRVLPIKQQSVNFLKDAGANQLKLFQEFLGTKYLEILRNDSQKIDLSSLIYFIDTIDSSKAIQNFRSEAFSAIESIGTPKNILDINFGLGHSAIQLATVFPDSTIYSLQLNPTLKEAFEYTIQKYQCDNVEYSTSYPSELTNKLMKEKIDLIYAINPLGMANPELTYILNIITQFVNSGSKIVYYAPLIEQPKNTFIAEWLAFCVNGLEDYSTIDNHKILFSKFNFDVDKDNNTRFLTATFYPD